MTTMLQELENTKSALKTAQDAVKKHADTLRVISDVAGGRPHDPNAYYYKLVLERLVGEDRFAKWFKESLNATEMAKRIEFHVASTIGVQAVAERIAAQEAPKPHASVQPLTLGRIVHYYQGPIADPMVAIVTRLDKTNPFMLHGHLFDSGGIVIVQNVPHWSAASVSGGPRWEWPSFK